MKLVIEIKMDNEAFSENCGAEAARILRDLAQDLEDDFIEPGMTQKLFDINGNRVGVSTVRK